jgi:hypothetical protein
MAATLKLVHNPSNRVVPLIFLRGRSENNFASTGFASHSTPHMPKTSQLSLDLQDKTNPNEGCQTMFIRLDLTGLHHRHRCRSYRHRQP